MMAKKAAEKGKKEAVQRKARDDEELRMAAMPVWKKQLIEKKMEDPKRYSSGSGGNFFTKPAQNLCYYFPQIRDRKRRKEREKERKKKLICKL